MNILITGVGGQGNIVLSRIISQIEMNRGNKVKTAENIGMSQRGGSVVSFIRINEDGGPIIPNNSADVCLSLELIEGIRNINKLHYKTKIAVNNKIIYSNLTSPFNQTFDGNWFKSNFEFVWIYNLNDLLTENKMEKAENIALLSFACKDRILNYSL